MSVLDAPVRQVAKNVIAQFGKTITLRRTTAPVYDPDTGETSPGTSDESVAAVIGTYSKREIGVTVQAGDFPITIAATAANLTAAPTVADQVVLDTQVFQIVLVASIYSGAEVAIYELQVRR